MSALVPDFASLTVCVVGDLIADRYLFTRPKRLSREAPVMVLAHRGEELSPGGAGNVVLNLRAAGATTPVVGVVGPDVEGRELLRLLEQRGADVSRVRPLRGWRTPTKTRVCSAETGRAMQQVLRIDREPAETLGADGRDELARSLRALAGEVDAVLLSDYGYGAVGAELREAVDELRRAGTVVVLDPRTAGGVFRGLTALTPNVGELAEATGTPAERLDDDRELVCAARELFERAGSELLLVTRGNRGMALFGEGELADGAFVEASGAEECVDPTGAGDTAAATFTLALAAGLDGVGAMRVANAASGVVVMEQGTATCPPDRLRAALRSGRRELEPS